MGLHHESNTFVSALTDRRAIEEAGIFRGEEVRRRYASSRSTMAGFLDVEAEGTARVEPLLFTFPNPRGPIARDQFDQLSAEMIELLRRGLPWDGVLLAQHGAAVARGHLDADAEVVERVREVVGRDVPIGVAADLHGNISARLVAASDVVVGYRTNPHADARERAFECAALVARMAGGELRPAQSMVRVPMVPNILCQGTSDEPMRSVYGALEEVLRTPGMLSASVFEGYPYADVPQMAMACLALHESSLEAAREAALTLGAVAWDQRQGLRWREALSPAAAIEEVLRFEPGPDGPLVLLDVGDNIGAGTPGDSTVLLEIAVRRRVPSFLVSLRDPRAVDACRAAGPGARVSLFVGAKADRAHGRPVPVEGTIRTLSDGRFEDPTPTHAGMRFFDAGPTAVLECDGGPTVVLHSKLIGNVSLEEHRSLGLDPRRFRAIVAKGVNSPRLAYEPIASRLLFVDTPGASAADLSQLAYRRRPRPLFPFEEAAGPEVLI
jgi:microcystin degradation protein MlrC